MDGTERVVRESRYFWHPGRRTLRMLGIGEDGRLSEGALHVDGDTLVFEYAAHTPEESTELLERWRFADDGTVEQKMWSEAENGERVLLLECSSHQRGEPR